MRKTKIVCTLGPATDNEDVLRRIILEGMDVARLNFSHGEHSSHQERIEKLKKVRAEVGIPVAILLDTKGPEIRVKKFKNAGTTLIEGSRFTLTTKDIEGDNSIVSITYPSLYQDVSIGTSILIDDGLIGLSVVEISGEDIICVVKNGGNISDNKSINIPNVSINMPYLSKKDREDIIFGIRQDVDFIAASFVRTHGDITDIRKILDQNGGNDIQIIAKIENQEGVTNIDKILHASDGIMVARGDMGVEIALEDLPVIQKRLIKQCYNAGKKVITATQMLDSMIRNPRPTRAETTDVANAIYDGTSAIMLSGETAIGKYPVESVKTMAKIALRAEMDINYKKRFGIIQSDSQCNITNAISHATCTTAHDLEAKAIVAVTHSGSTARMVSKYRPNCPIIAAAPSERVMRQLNLSWGVIPVLTEYKTTTDELFDHVVDIAVEKGYLENGDLVVITAGVPLGMRGTTNILKVHLVGHVLTSGEGANELVAVGSVRVIKNGITDPELFEDGEILVTDFTDNSMLPIIKRAKGIICEQEGLGSHAVVAGMALEIPVITGACGATEVLKNGGIVTIDGARGLVYSGNIDNL